MPELARQVLAQYGGADRGQDLSTLFRLQIAAGRHADALATLKSLRDQQKVGDPAHMDVELTPYEIYARAMRRQSTGELSFEEAYGRSFREVFGSLSDQAAFEVEWMLGTALSAVEHDLQQLLDRYVAMDSIDVDDAADLVGRYLAYRVWTRCF